MERADATVPFSWHCVKSLIVMSVLSLSHCCNLCTQAAGVTGQYCRTVVLHMEVGVFKSM